MSKELVISSNRHETKVAILEDDQLVEVYFQRANEYSLAGSVHKGRVTRVLPGMQSAFVDLGLDRDTFLYVSDFFEENEEYDRISGPAEERPQRIERPPVIEEAETPVESESPAPAEEAVAEAAPETAAAPASDERAEDQDGRDRRGRRSRRRRNRGRGFPESKYASRGEERREPEKTVETASGDAFSVLPGESLAKYRDQPEAIDEEEAADLQAAIEEPEAAEPEAAEPEAEPAPHTEANGAEEVESIVSESPEEEPPANAIPDAPLHPEAARESELPTVPHTETDESAPEEPDVTVLEIEAIGEATPDDDEDREIQALIFDEGEPGGETVPAAAEPENKELSANVRDQGSRYLHRVSRRTRRRMRTNPEAGAAQPVPAPAPAPKPDHRPAPRPDKGSTPSITELLKEGQEIIVQIAKEPLGQKGARITSHIALPGRYVVYMPTLDHMGVSRKIASDEERQRLKRILQKHRAGIAGGFIIRTAGEGKTEDEIAADMTFLGNLWIDIRQKAEKHPAPVLLHHDLDIVQRILRDQVNDSYKAVWVDNEELYESILRFVQRFQPALVARVKLYTRPAPVFDAFNITQELEKALRPKVWLKSGGYIVINQTEALVAIDVNTGKYVGKSNRLEDTIVKTNTEAIKEIVRQLRLRDLGGIIVIDFIDMDERKNRQKVMQVLEEAMRSDRAPYKILQFNDFGLVAITRKRVKQSLERTLCAPCPYCEGAGYVKSVQTIIGEILQEAHKIVAAIEGKDVLLRVHPDVAKILKSNQNKYLEELEEILKRPVLVTSDAALHHEKFDLV
jgi:ribonuclease G